MNSEDYKSMVLTLKEQFEDGFPLDDDDIKYLFGIISHLEAKSEGYERVIRSGRHIISD